MICSKTNSLLFKYQENKTDFSGYQICVKVSHHINQKLILALSIKKTSLKYDNGFSQRWSQGTVRNASNRTNLVGWFKCDVPFP